MDLKEYIKSLIRQQLEEMSTTAAIGVGAGPIMTPKAFSPKGQKTNAATKQAERSGWKKAPTGMPSDSKIKDYKPIWKSAKKSRYKMYEQSITNETSTTIEALGKVRKVTGSDPGTKRTPPPRGFELPREIFDLTYKSNKNTGETRKLFRIVSKGNESVLLVDDLVRVALDGIERGRSSFEKEQRLPEITRLIKEKVPLFLRGIIKSTTSGINAGTNGYVTVPLKVTHEDLTFTPKSTTNRPAQITERGIELLRDIKYNREKYQDLSKEYIAFLIQLYKNKETPTTPGDLAASIGLSTNGASRYANVMEEEGILKLAENIPPINPEKWYISNPKFEGNELDTEFGVRKYGDSQIFKSQPSNIKEMIDNVIKQELLNEVTYTRFKNEVKHRTKSEQLHKAIREVKRKLQEIDRIVEYTSRMKQELSEDEGGVSYWKATQNNIGKISEMVNHLNNKIKNLHQ